MYDVCIESSFCIPCLYSRGAWTTHFNISENSTCTQGEHNPFPLMTKGESDLGLPSSPNGEIVGIMTQVWHYETGVVLDGNSLIRQIIV